MRKKKRRKVRTKNLINRSSIAIEAAIKENNVAAIFCGNTHGFSVYFVLLHCTNKISEQIAHMTNIQQTKEKCGL